MRGGGKTGGLAAVLAAVALMVIPAQAGAITLFRADVPVGTQPTSVAVSNFNGGPADLAVANEGDDSVSILIGNGLGQFTATTPVSVGDLPSSVVTGEFNGDAFADLAVASVGDDNIAIRLGNGSGGFTGTGMVATGLDPRAIVAGDFNNDNKTDLVSANTGASTVSVLLGDGMGAFTADASPCIALCTAAENPVAIAVGKFDDIGGPDLTLDAIVASQTDDQVLELFGDGTGEFNGAGTTYTMATSMMNPNPSALTVGSLNPSSNSEPDLLVANQTPDQVWPAFGDVGGSGFGYGGVLSTGAGSDPAGLAMGDLDGDGDQDGITANSGTANATVIISNGGGGTMVDTSHPVGTSPRSVAMGAFDNDARMDAVLANYGSNSVTVLTSLAPGPPPPAAVTPSAPSATPATPAKKKCKKGRKLKKGKCVRKKPKKR